VLDHQAVLTPYSGIIGPAKPQFTSGDRAPAGRSALFDHLTPEVAKGVARLVTDRVSYFTQLRAVGGAVNDVDPAETAYPHRHQNFHVVAMSGAPRREHLDEPWDAWLLPYADGTYLSFETDPRPERLTDAFPEPTLTRLRRIKRVYDPGNVFNTNFPIPPAVD